MHRIDTPTAQADKFGQGKNGFTNGDPATGRRATDLNSDMWDAVQEEICTAIEKSGAVLNKGQHDQLYQAIVKLITDRVPDALLRSKNLSDVVDKALARSNLELKSAATCDIQTSKGDVTTGRVVVNGGALALRSVTAKGSGGTVSDVNSLPQNSVSFIYSDATNSPGFSASMIDFSGLLGSYNAQFAAQYDGSGNRLSFRTHNGNENVWNPWYSVYHTGNKPTAADTNALPIPGGTMTGEIIGAYNGSQGWGGQYSSLAPFYNVFSSSGGSDYHPLIKQKGTTLTNSWAFSQGMMNSNGNLSWMLHMRGSGGDDIQFIWDTGGNFSTYGRVNPSDYGNFDARYNRKNTAALGNSGWCRDESTGLIMQWGSVDSARGTYTFPRAFSQACFAVFATNKDGQGGAIDNAYGYPVSNTQFFLASKANSGQDTAYGISWFALGY